MAIVRDPDDARDKLLKYSVVTGSRCVISHSILECSFDTCSDSTDLELPPPVQGPANGAVIRCTEF